MSYFFTKYILLQSKISIGDKMEKKSNININIDKNLKKKLKLLSIEEEVTMTEIIIGFIEFGIREYSVSGKLLK